MEDFFKFTRVGNYEAAKKISDTVENDSLRIGLKNYLNVIRDGDFSGISTNYLTKLNSITTILNTLNYGVKTYITEGNQLKAFEILQKNLSNAKKINNKVLICENLKHILEIYERFDIPINDISYKYFINDYEKYAYDEVEKEIALLYKYRITQRFNLRNPEKVIVLHKELMPQLKKINTPFYSAKRDLTYFVYHQNFIKNLDSCSYYIEKTLKNLNGKKGFFENERLKAALINKASLLINLGHPKKAIDILDTITLNNNYLDNSLKKFLLYKKHLAYDALNMELESCNIYNEYINLVVENNQTKNLQIVSEYETKYQTTEKEKQILIEQQKKKQNRNIAFGLGGLLLFGGITFLLIQKNTKRKQLFAEQEKELQTQKLATVLKEQELTSIDAMIEGQEKERQRIANDLHDDLGGLMATVKLHFNALKEKQSPELYDKTTKLLDEAYNKVRTVAHTKNSGVMAKKGLLKAVNDMAKTISASNKLKVDVIDYGLESRLENSLELTIFRIIQELTANIIKHAKATEATIHITNHNESLNIMVEDNGIGFNTKTIRKSSGMGIHSIDKRIENLGGTVTIESEHKKGTTVIIDIPS